MKSELISKSTVKRCVAWFIDESKCLTAREVRKLRRTTLAIKALGVRDMQFRHIRNWFMVELGLHAGLRVEEMASLKHGDLLINEERSTIIVLGKGQKVRPVWISSYFKMMCQEYIEFKKAFGYGVDEDSYLINHSHGGRLTKRALQKAFMKLIEIAKLPSHYHIHSLRHTYATFLLKASGRNYRFVQQQLGHASMQTTQGYLGVLESERKNALEKLYT